MKRLAEATIWTSAAIAAHVGIAAWAMQSEGAPVAVQETAAAVAVTAADASVAEMVAEWETPPEVAPVVSAIAQPMVQPDMPPAMNAPDMPTRAPVMTQAAPLPEVAAPVIDTAPATPQVAVLTPTETDVRPPVRPADLGKPKPEPTPEPVREPAPEPAPEPQRRVAEAAPAAPQAAPSAGSTAAPAVTEGQRQTAMSDWSGRVRAAVERRKSYPRAAGRATGVAVIRISVSGAGALQGLALAQSSGNALLDEAALNAARAARYPVAPDVLGGGVFTFNLPVNFSR